MSHKIMAGWGVEGLQSPIIQNEQIGTAEITRETRMAAIAARQGEALLAHRAVLDRDVGPQRRQRLLEAGRAADDDFLTG